MTIVENIQMILRDSGVFWNATQILDALNEAQLHVHLELKWKKISSSLIVNTNDDIVSIPNDIVIPTMIVGVIDQSVMRFFPSTLRELETYSRHWRGTDPSQPKRFIIFDYAHLRLWPKPDMRYTYTIWGVGYPTEITTSTETIEGPAPLAVKNFALALLLNATRLDLSRMYLAQSSEDIQEQKKKLRNSQSHNIRRIRPGKNFDIKQSGTIRANTYYEMQIPNV